MTLSQAASIVLLVTTTGLAGCAKKLDNTALSTPDRHAAIRAATTTEPAAAAPIDNSSVIDAFSVFAVI